MNIVDKAVANRLLSVFSDYRAGKPIPKLYELVIESVMSHKEFDQLCRTMKSTEEIHGEFVKSISENGIHLEGECLLMLIKYIMNYEKGRREIDDTLAVNIFRMNCRHEGKADLIFYPFDILGTENPTPEQVFRAATGGSI